MIDMIQNPCSAEKINGPTQEMLVVIAYLSREISNHVVYVTSKGSDQPVCANAQSDQSLC